MASHSESRPRLTRDFYGQEPLELAQALLGKRLVVVREGQRVSGRIVETEAYCATGTIDLACHASKNKGRPTPRTAVMFEEPGLAFIYLTYGMHWMFNVVTKPKGEACAILIRALEPVEGEAWMQAHRPKRPRLQWTSGPAKLTQALQIDKNQNGENLCDPSGVVWIEEDVTVPASQISIGPRIGLGKTPEPWFSMPWRYWVTGNPFVSV